MEGVQTAFSLKRRVPTALYVHVPFCNGKCDYCAFYSEGCDWDDELQDMYLDSVLAEMTRHAKSCGTLDSVFVGGGTPTVLHDRAFQRLLQGIRERFDLSPQCEWTVECNPESLTEAKIDMMGEIGVTRASLGIQSFNQSCRKMLGRRGTLDGLEHKIRVLRHAGISHVNLDLIWNVPTQTLQMLEQDLNRALDFEPDHISAYALTVEEGTRLAERQIEADDDTFVEAWDLIEATLATRGLHRYEISNFATARGRCRHNDSIWHGAAYLGLGPAATSFDGVDRWTQPANLRQWIGGQDPEIDRIPPLDRAAEILAFGLRTVEGWNLVEFRNLTEVDPIQLRGQQLQKLQKAGLVELDKTTCKPTPQGLLFNDSIIMELI